MGICLRIIDDFIRTKPLTANLTLIFTTRDATKGEATRERLQRHLNDFGTSFVAKGFSKRIQLRSEIVDLTNLLSIRALCKNLLDSKIPKLDAVILNAGIGGWSGINWPQAVWQVATDWIQGVTWPVFKMSAVGRLTGMQLPATKATGQAPEPKLGEVFCANVFGHYLLAHWLMPLLRSCDEQSRGRIIWISSIEVSSEHFDPDDLQGLRSPEVYVHTKRLTDLLALTAADQPSTAKAVQGFLQAKPKQASSEPDGSQPTIHLAHPGIVATSIVPLTLLLRWAMLFAFLIARWVGSPWHTISIYTAASAPVWLTMASQDAIKAKETGTQGKRGTAKWGSATDRGGTDMVMKTEVSGWGVDGSGSAVEWWNEAGWGRMRGAKDATKEEIETFVEQGAKAWREMEQVREEWERRIAEYESSEKVETKKG